LTMLVMVGVRTKAYIFRSQVGIGSESDCLLGQLKRILVLYKHNHVMHRLLPPKKRLQYKLRPRNHNLVLTSRTSYYESCNFITRVIFSDAY